VENALSAVIGLAFAELAVMAMETAWDAMTVYAILAANIAKSSNLTTPVPASTDDNPGNE